MAHYRNLQNLKCVIPDLIRNPERVIKSSREGGRLLSAARLIQIYYHPEWSEGSLMRTNQYAVYIMASLSGTIYTGFTTNLVKRVWEHKNNAVRGFTSKYQCHKLVYYEICDSFEGALAREKEIKGWNRKKKENLIKTMNPTWKDLYESIL